jgi:hypothetical protein
MELFILFLLISPVLLWWSFRLTPEQEGRGRESDSNKGESRKPDHSIVPGRILLVTVSIFVLVYMGVPPMGLLFVGLIGGFLSVPSGDSNKLLSPLLTIPITNGILWLIMNIQISSTPRLSPSSSRDEISSVISGILSQGNDPPGNWFENWELFVVMMVVGSVVGVVYQNQNQTPQTESSSPSPSPDPEPQVESSPRDSLQSLTEMKNEGLITEEEFDSKKKELLDRL